MWNIFLNVAYIVVGFTWALLTGEVSRLEREARQ